MKRRQGRAPRGTGQTLVEFALVLPVIVLMLFGILDLGRAVYAYNTIANAARIGARVAAVNQILTSPDCNESRPVEDPADAHWSIRRCAADAAVSLGVQPLPGPNGVDVSYQKADMSGPCPTPLQLGCVAVVTVRYSYQPMTPFVGHLFSSIPMDATSEMPIERVFP
jgi:hypothetical protein